MNRFFVILLSFLHLVLSTGFTTSVHFCKGVRQEANIFNHVNPDSPCPVCVAKYNQKQKKKDCCKHEKQLVKLSAEVKKTAPLDIKFKVWGFAIPNQMIGTVFDSEVLADQNTTCYIPSDTPVPGNPLYILYCNYRI
ncbi:hypothetical protein D3C80_1632580 [compost metagenome]